MIIIDFNLIMNLFFKKTSFCKEKLTWSSRKDNTAKTQVTHRRFSNLERKYLENGKRERLVIFNKYVSR
jgi:hypothetical protein